MQQYIDFLKSKMAISAESGFDIEESEITNSLYPHVKDSVKWAIKGGCRAIFSSFGLHKTVTQIDIVRIITKREKGKGLIVCPKRVVMEFLSQAKERRDNLSGKIAKVVEIINRPENINDNFLLWHDLEAEINKLSPTLFDLFAC